MDRHYIESNQIVSHYVRGKLNSRELHKFELFMLDHPEYLDEIRLEAGMQEQLLQHRHTLFAEQFPMLSWLRNNVYSLAASVLLSASLIVTAMLYQSNHALRQSLAQLSAPTVARELYLEVSRSSEPIVIQALPNETLLLNVDIARIGQGPLRVSMFSDTAQTIAPLRIENSDNIISLSFRPNAGGNYRVRVEDEQSDELISEIDFVLSLSDSLRSPPLP